MAEDTTNIPIFDAHSSTSSLISFIEINEKHIHDKLVTLHVSKPAGLDGMHPKIISLFPPKSMNYIIYLNVLITYHVWLVLVGCVLTDGLMG